MTITDLAHHVSGEPFKYKHGWKPLFGSGDVVPKPAPESPREQLRMVTDSHGLRHWGQYGGAGVLVRHTDENGTKRYFMQQRAKHVDQGGTWSTPGGGIDPGESVTDAAHREVQEEIGDIPVPLTHSHTVTADYGDWKYHTVVMDSPERFVPGGSGSHAHEDAGNGWYTADEIGKMPLHPGFARSWPTVRDASGDVTIPAGADEAKEQAAKRAALAAELGKQGVHPYMTKAGATERGLAEAKATGKAKFIKSRDDFHEGKSYTYLENKPKYAPFYVLTPDGQIIYWTGHKSTKLQMSDMEMSTPANQALAIELAAINGHHVAGTAYHYYHGWKAREGQSLVADIKKGTHTSGSSPEEKLAKTKALKSALDAAKAGGMTEHVYVVRKPGKGGKSTADWKHGTSFSGHGDLGTATNRTRYTIAPDGTITKYQGKKALYTLNSREHVAAGLVPGDPAQSDIRRAVMDEDAPGSENVKAESAAESKAEDIAARAAQEPRAAEPTAPAARRGPSGPIHDKVVAGTTTPLNQKSPNSVLSHALVNSHKSGKPLYVHKDQYGDWQMQTTPEPGKAGYIVHPDHRIEGVSDKGKKYTYKPETMEKVMAKSFGPQPEAKGLKAKLGKAQPAFATPGLNKPAAAPTVNLPGPPSVAERRQAAEDVQRGKDLDALGNFVGSKTPTGNNFDLTQAQALHKALWHSDHDLKTRYVVNFGQPGEKKYAVMNMKPDNLRKSYVEVSGGLKVTGHSPGGKSGVLPHNGVMAMLKADDAPPPVGLVSIPKGPGNIKPAERGSGPKAHPFKVGDHVTGETPSGDKLSGKVTHAAHLASGKPYVMVKDDSTGKIGPLSEDDANLTSSIAPKKFKNGDLVSGYKSSTGKKVQGTVLAQGNTSVMVLGADGSSHMVGMDRAEKLPHPSAPDVPDNVPEHVITGRPPADEGAVPKVGDQVKGKDINGASVSGTLTKTNGSLGRLGDGDSAIFVKMSDVSKVAEPGLPAEKQAKDDLHALISQGGVKATPSALAKMADGSAKAASYHKMAKALFKAHQTGKTQWLVPSSKTGNLVSSPHKPIMGSGPGTSYVAYEMTPDHRVVQHMTGTKEEIKPSTVLKQITPHSFKSKAAADAVNGAEAPSTVTAPKTPEAPKAKKVYASTPAGQIAKAVDEFKVPDGSTSLSKGDAFKKAMHYAHGTGDSRYVTNPQAKKGQSYMSEAIGQYAYEEKKPTGDAPYYEIKPDQSVIYHGDSNVDIAPENVAKTVTMASTSFGSYVAPTKITDHKVPAKEHLDKFTAGEGFTAGNVAPPTQKDLDTAHKIMDAVHEKIDSDGLGDGDHLYGHYKSKVKANADQKGELRNYTESSSYINDPLREYKGKLPEGHYIQKRADILDSLMDKYKTDKPMRVYRGVGGGVFPHGTDVTGHIYTEPGYSSTTLTVGGTGFGGTIQMAITIPAGSHLAFPKGLGSSVDTHPGEREVLLPRNTRYLVVSDEMKGGTRHVEMVVLPPIKEGQTSAQLAKSQAASTAAQAAASSTIHHAA